MILCPNCGANPRFDIASQQMLCPFCGTYSEPTDERYDAAKGADMQEVNGDYVGQSDMMQVKIYTCSQCGAELMSTDNDATAFCSYCGTHQILQERLDVKKRPDHIIPFKITKDQCKQIYGNKLKKMLFAPKILRNPQYIDEFRGIYMPYWFYNFTQKGKININGTKEHRSGNYRIIDHYNLSVDADNLYRGISHDASSSFEDNISESLAPYNTKDAVPFRTAYLSGFYADIPDTESATYEHDAALIAAQDAFDTVLRTPGFGGYNTSGIKDDGKITRTQTRLQSAANAMFPVWFLSYRNRDRVAYAAINGQTGKMMADIPIDKKKYLLVTAILTLIIWGILQVFNISSLRGIVMTVLACALLGGLVYGLVLDKLKCDTLNREWERAMGDQPPAQQAPAQGPQGTGKPKKAKKSKKKLKKESDLGLGGILIMYAIIIAVCGIAVFMELGIIMLAAPVVMAVYAQLSLSELEYKRGVVSNWALMGVMELSIIVWLLNPYKDPVYYICCLLMTVCVVWCFFDVLFYYNQLMTRPLPQFNKKGGDDLA
ncbi:hypothetical protein SAMN02910292_01274 [Lachnospiraceae bacterium XBB2008]|nr:hypothetical protein SAMN02910292_01274 [Lachnospiraceae bacterium XBB2008]